MLTNEDLMRYSLICLVQVISDFFHFVIRSFLKYKHRVWSQLMFAIICFYMCLLQFSH